jgi:hypothetical protein
VRSPSLRDQLAPFSSRPSSTTSALESPLYPRLRDWESRETTTGSVVPFRARKPTETVRAAARDDDDATETSGGAWRTSLLREDELRAIEAQYEHGLTAVQVVDVFTSRSIRFSEASFRKYVQQGLLPRSRRVGRKGKHKGSLGLYPAKTIRRINSVKQLMADGYTIEEIQAQFLVFTDLLENVAENLAALWVRIDGAINYLEPAPRRDALKQLGDARRDGDRLVERVGDLARAVAAPRNDTLRLTGAAGGAEDLL